jgi:hypothetical protein
LGKGAAISPQLVRGGGGVSVSKSFPATLAFISARCWCACRWDCADGLPGPQMSLCTGHAAEADEPRANPSRAPSRDCVQRRPAGIRRRELFCGRGVERQKDGDVALVPRRFPAQGCQCWCACRRRGRRRRKAGQSVVGAATSGGGAESRDGGIPGAGFLGEREGSRADASQRHELRYWRVVRMLGFRQRSSVEGRT